MCLGVEVGKLEFASHVDHTKCLPQVMFTKSNNQDSDVSCLRYDTFYDESFDNCMAVLVELRHIFNGIANRMAEVMDTVLIHHAYIHDLCFQVRQDY